MARAVILVALSLVSGCGASSGSSALPGPTSTAERSTAAAQLTAAPATPSPLSLLGPMPRGAIDAGTGARLQKVLDGVVGSGAPDAIAAVVTADGTWAGAAGFDGPDHRPAQAQDEFGIASVSKLILATLVVRLAELGKLDLDAPLSKYLNGIDVNANGATVRQALVMQSGLGDSIPGTVENALAHCDRAFTRDAVVATIPPPFAAPGTTYHYSNPTYKLLGYAAEQAAGMPLAAALRTLVLDPVKVDRIQLQGPDRTTPKPWALPLDGHNGGLDVPAFGTGGTLPCLGFSTGSLAAAAIASDAPSLARWGWGLFAGDIISADSLSTLASTGTSGSPTGIEQFAELLPDVAYGHSGSQVGYAAVLAVLPVRQVAVVAFINDEASQGDVIQTASSLVDAINR